MVPAAELLDQARARGVILRARGETLVVDGPEAAVNEVRPAGGRNAYCVFHIRQFNGVRTPVPLPEYAIRNTPACWRYFPEAQLTVVQEALGRGFRCRNCLRGG